MRIISCAAGLLFVAACADAGTGPMRGTGDIAFASNRGGQYDLYLMNADGGDVTKVTRYAGPCAWSPDGTKIAFQSYQDATTAPDIYVTNADGSQVVRLTHSPGDDSQCAWSPNGATLAFGSGREHGHFDIYAVGVDGTGERRLTNSDSQGRPYNGQPTWSPDGTRIAFTSSRDPNDGIYLMNADGSNQVRLSSPRAWACCPAWSPDGTKIAYVSFIDSSYRSTREDIFVINVDGSGEMAVISLPSQEYAPSWSPDGAKLAFGSLRRDLSAYELYAVNADGTALIKLGVDVWPDRPPAWSADGTRLVFASYPNPTSDIYAARSDGMGLTRLTQNAADDATPLGRPAPGKH